MPLAPESQKAIEDARACAERLFHAYSGAASKATSQQARDLFGRLASWSLHHFEEIDRAQNALGESAAWVEYSSTDFDRTDASTSDRKDLWDRSTVQYFNEQEAVASVLDVERANFTFFLGLAAKAQDPRERDFWTQIAADEDLHVRVLKEQLEQLRSQGRWTWAEVREKGAPKPSVASARSTVAMISPLSTAGLSTGRKERRARGEVETELLPPGWENNPSAAQPGAAANWVPPPITDPKTPMPGSLPVAVQPAPGGGWISVDKQVQLPPDTPPSRPAGSSWVPMGSDMSPTPHAQAEQPRKKKSATTIRHAGRKATDPPQPYEQTDTTIMDRPLAHTGGRWVYEASVKTAEQLCAPKKPPSDADCLALITGSCRRVFLDILNRRGSQGWELLQLGFHADSVVMFWKRRE